jgi:ABC-type multidrug transport system fused ATPase/permease subunit
MKDGKISEFGTFQELMDADQGFANQMKTYGGMDKDSPAHSPVLGAADLKGSESKSPATKDAPVSPSKGKEKAAKLMQAEERATGSVDWSVYRSYFAAAGGATAITFILLLLFISQLFRVGNDLWLSFWTSDTFKLKKEYYLVGYFGWGLAQAVSYVFSGMQFAYAAVYASRTMHESALLRVLRSPMSFFDTTPLGTIYFDPLTSAKTVLTRQLLCKQI